MDLTQLRGLTPAQILKAAWGKFVFRRTRMGMYAVDADDQKKVRVEGYETTVLPGEDIDFDELANPYMSREDFDEVRRLPGARCVLVRDAGKIIASNWYLRGEVPVTELDTTLELLDGWHYSCRTFIHPGHRGRHLMGHMMTGYVTATPECRMLCGLVYDWNEASIGGLRSVGWARVGTMTTDRILGFTRRRTTASFGKPPNSRESGSQA